MSAFRKQHGNPSAAQYELILLMRSFFNQLIMKNKLFMHATVVVRDDWAYVILAPKSGGKSTFAKQMVENQPGRALIFSVDRIVLGVLEEIMIEWPTFGGKISNGNPAQHFEVECICMVGKALVVQFAMLWRIRSFWNFKT